MEAAEGMKQQVKMRVAVRVRPFNSRETMVMPVNIVEMSDGIITLTNPESKDTRQFTFDSCFWSHDGFIVNKDGVAVPAEEGSKYASQEAVFKDIGVSTLNKAWEGYNAAILAYGMTGSGKTYTMLGNKPNSGLLEQCCNHLFSQIDENPQNKYKVTFSMLEIYNEGVIDLLSKSALPLKVRKNRDGVYVQNLTEMPMKNASQINEVLMQGLQNRSVAATKMNTTSSRSHLIVTVNFVQFITGHHGKRIKRQSRIRFIDMAGSERTSHTGATGDRLAEGKMINKSISGLAFVINSLVEREQKGKGFVPYRNSKFTYIMSDELGGNCVTTMLVTISPASMYHDDTMSALRLAQRARMVSQNLVVNEADVDVEMKSIKADIASLETELASAPEESKTTFQELIDAKKTELQQLEAPWKEKEYKDKGGIWWSTNVQLQQIELDTTPYMQNISEDNYLSGVTKHVIPQGHNLLGCGDTANINIKLSGLGIQPLHAILVNSGSTLSIAPCSSKATIHVNGLPIRAVKPLNHMDRIKLGAGELFCVIGFPSSRAQGNSDAAKHSHEKCLTELAENHPLYSQLKPSTSACVRTRTAALLLFQEFTDLLPQVAQAQAMASNFGKNIEFEVQVMKNEKSDKVLQVHVVDKDLGMEWIWSKGKFEDRILAMDELHEQFVSSGNIPRLTQNNDPFIDKDNPDVLLGRSTASLHNVVYSMPVHDDVPVFDASGKQVATVQVNVDLCIKDGKSPNIQGALQDPKSLLNKPLELKCTIPYFCGINWTAGSPNRGIYFKVFIHGMDKTTETVSGVVSGKFKQEFPFSFDTVTQSLLDALQTEGLLLELWGTQNTSTQHPVSRSLSAPSAQSEPQASGETNSDLDAAGGLTFDLVLAQDLRQFFTDVSTVQRILHKLKQQAEENSKTKEVQLRSWEDCSSNVQTARAELHKHVLTLKESVKMAIRRSKQM